MSNPIVTLATMFNPPIPTPPNPASMVPPPATVPGNPATPVIPAVTTPAAIPTPLDTFADLWKNDPNYKPPVPVPMFNLDPDKMAASAAQIDFKPVITPEIATRMKAGGDDGMAAMMEVMNSMSQTVFVKAATAAATIAEEGIKKNEKQLLSRIPSLLKNQTLKNSLQENPALSHPSVAPMVDQIAKQLQVKFPSATPAELNTKATELFVGLAKMVTQQVDEANPEFQRKNTVKKSEDFSDW